jgi:hypothetical protein
VGISIFVPKKIVVKNNFFPLGTVRWPFSLAVLWLCCFAPTDLSAQARLTIENNSGRNMTVKIMAGTGESASLHEMVTISPYGESTVYFSRTGYYFTKTKAVVNGKEPVYQKGQPFHVTNDDTGYSVMTITFTIKESAVPQVSGGKQISKQEFDRN